MTQLSMHDDVVNKCVINIPLDVCANEFTLVKICSRIFVPIAYITPYNRPTL